MFAEQILNIKKDLKLKLMNFTGSVVNRFVLFSETNEYNFEDFKTVLC